MLMLMLIVHSSQFSVDKKQIESRELGPIFSMFFFIVSTLALCQYKNLVA